MLIRESIEKTKNFLEKSIVNLKSLFVGSYQKLPKSSLLNPFSCSFRSSKRHQKDLYCTDCCSAWESDLEEVKERKKNIVVASNKPVNEGNASSLRLADQSLVKSRQEERKEEVKKMGSSRKYKLKDRCSRNMKPDEGYSLAEKMKQLDMMDAGDVEHVLDVEEALHYYSRLKSPAYVGIVDRFFMDMYSELSVPQPSARTNSSKRRHGSNRL